MKTYRDCTLNGVTWTERQLYNYYLGHCDICMEPPMDGESWPEYINRLQIDGIIEEKTMTEGERAYQRWTTDADAVIFNRMYDDSDGCFSLDQLQTALRRAGYDDRHIGIVTASLLEYETKWNKKLPAFKTAF